VRSKLFSDHPNFTASAVTHDGEIGQRYDGGDTNPGQLKPVKLDRVHDDPAQTLGQLNDLAV